MSYPDYHEKGILHRTPFFEALTVKSTTLMIIEYTDPRAYYGFCWSRAKHFILVAEDKEDCLFEDEGVCPWTDRNAESLYLCGFPALVLQNGSTLALIVGGVMGKSFTDFD